MTRPDPETWDALREAALGWSRRQASLARPDTAAWQEMAALGWFGLAVPESLGGLGLAVGDLAPIAENLGRFLRPEPVMAVAGVVAPLLAQFTADQIEKLFRHLIDGTRIISLAHREPDAGFDRDFVTTMSDQSWHLTGQKIAIEGGAVATSFLVTAMAENGLALFLVPREAPGVTVTPYQSLDGRRIADLRLENAVATQRLTGPDIATVIDDALDHGAFLAIADAVGAMECLLEDTLAYLQTRKQFGQPLARFQALQHRAVDMAIALEEARGVVESAAIAIAADDRPERIRAIATAKIIGARAARLIAREAVQLHGGIGITGELRISHLFRRLVVAESLYGDVAHFHQRFRGAGAQPAW